MDSTGLRERTDHSPVQEPTCVVEPSDQDRAGRIISFALLVLVILIGLAGVVVMGAGLVDQELLSQILSTVIRCH